MKNKLILVTGGARSGKSTFAEQLAGQLGTQVTYIATAQAYDDEMQVRIRLHQARRGEGWITREAPFDAASALREASAETAVILLDCLTLYVTNHLLQTVPGGDDQNLPTETCTAAVMKVVQDLAEAAKGVPATVIIVTNEVGMGIVPDNALSRMFRDIAGFANQCLADAADEVYLLVSGIPLKIKPSSQSACVEGEGHG